MKTKSIPQKVKDWNKQIFPAKLEKRSGKNNYELVIDWKNVPASMRLKKPRSQKQIDKLISDLEKSIEKK